MSKQEILNRNANQRSVQSLLCCLGLGTALYFLLVPGAVLAQAGATSRTTPDEWKAVVAAAQKEGKASIYGSISPEKLTELKGDFEKVYPGIKLEATRYSSGPIITKLDQERQTATDGADVAVTTEVVWFEDRIKEGAIKAPVGPSAGSWPPAFRLASVAPVLAMEPIVIVYNTKEVKTPISGYNDLLNPEFKGKIGVLDLVASIVVAYYDWIDKGQGGNFMSRLAMQQPRVYTSSPTGAQSVASGETPIAIFVNPASVLPLVKLGAPMKMVFPNPSFGNRLVGGVLGWSKRPNAAQVLLDYLMSVRGQTVWNSSGDSASALTNIPGSLDAKALDLVDLRPYDRETTNAYRVKFSALFKK